jgi:hypothetical protein
VAEIKASPGIHNHKVRVVGDDLLYVNNECLKTPEGKTARAGIQIFDISSPATPKEVGFYDLPGNGPHRFGVDNERQLAFIPNDAEGWRNRVSWTVDISDPLKPELLSLWGLPEQDLSLNLPYEEAETMEQTTQCHGPAIIRGDRMFCGFWGGGMGIADCSDLKNIKHISELCWSPPFIGSTHTVWPVDDRPYLIATDEARSHTNYRDSQFMWIIDIRDETNPWPNIIFLTYFNAGLRAVDVSDPFYPREVGYFVPEMNFGQPCCQSNDIGMDDEGRLYLIDRNGAGMHILEYTG